MQIHFSGIHYEKVAATEPSMNVDVHDMNLVATTAEGDQLTLTGRELEEFYENVCGIHLPESKAGKMSAITHGLQGMFPDLESSLTALFQYAQGYFKF